jgi:hypothetical protein
MPLLVVERGGVVVGGLDGGIVDLAGGVPVVCPAGVAGACGVVDRWVLAGEASLRSRITAY